MLSNEQYELKEQSLQSNKNTRLQRTTGARLCTFAQQLEVNSVGDAIR